MDFHPRPVSDERAGYAAYLAQQNAAFRALAHGLTHAQLHAAPSASENSIAWLLHHVAVVQENWLAGALAAPEPLTAEQNAIIEARFHASPEGRTAEELLAGLDDVGKRVVDAAASLDPNTPVPVPDAPWFPKDIEHWSVRWVWLHLTQELARHAGHGDVIRETIDGASMYELMAADLGHTEPVFGFLAPWQATPAPFTRGFSTVVLAAEDVSAAKDWYADLLGRDAYYQTPAYVEFRIGPHDHELGILDRRYAGAGWQGEPAGDPTGAVVHLWVADADEALADLERRGARLHQPARTFGDDAGYRGGSVVDPFGNVLGVITRPTATVGG